MHYLACPKCHLPLHLEGNSYKCENRHTYDLSKSKYINIITTALSNGEFEKQKNALITYNDVTTKTNSYSVTLNSEQVKKLSLEILNNLKNDMDLFKELPQNLGIKQIEQWKLPLGLFEVSRKWFVNGSVLYRFDIKKEIEECLK